MTHYGDILRGTVTLLGIVLLAGGLVWLTLKKAEDPAWMLFKWVLTLIIGWFMVWKVAPLVGQGGYGGAFGGIPLAAVCGLALAIIWRRSLASLAAKPFTALYDGGNIPPEPRPAYSVAQSRQKKGLYLEAVAEIRKQLDRFPTDFEGHMLLAQIQAENLQDLPGAELTIQRLVAQPGHAPRNIVFALYSLADWHLKFGQDPEAARRALQQLIERLPDSEFALGAAQRIAHLSSTEMLLDPHQRKTFALPEGQQNLGLAKNPQPVKPPEKDPGQQAADYVRHLEQHPLDAEARERLAVLYASHYGRLDLAADQLEQMIAQPNQPARLVVHWLNLLADLQLRHGADYETIRATLQRIIDRDPNLAPAEMARKRINLIRLELKGQQQTHQPIRLGVYEQNIGLHRDRPPRQTG